MDKPEHIGDRCTVWNGDVLDTPWPIADGSVQCCVTSPPYWGLRDYGVAGQLGLEKVMDCLGWATGKPCGECYICRMVRVFREVRRVLREDGTVWCNMGDSYTSGGRANRDPGASKIHPAYDTAFKDGGRPDTPSGLKPKDLCGVPWRLALALQADGWYLRSDMPWLKRNAMPESVTDRPATAVEHIFLLTKSGRYHYDAEAVKVPGAEPDRERNDRIGGANGHTVRHSEGGMVGASPTRNRRNSDWFFESWQGLYSEGDEPLAFIVNPSAYKGAHFATFSPKLVEPCILAGTSPKACPACGKCWERQTETKYIKNRPSAGNDPRSRDEDKLGGARGHGGWQGNNLLADTRTLGFAPACACEGNDGSGRCLVLDPFVGSGTTLAVALSLNCRAVGLELNPEYIELARTRIGKAAAQKSMF
jgi:DNA modification methylase